MTRIFKKHIRILALTPSTIGFGFAVLDRGEKLADWGIKRIKGDKNAESLAKADKLIAHYHPDVMVLQDASAKNSRRSERIQALSNQIIAMAATHKVKVALFSPEKVRLAYFADGQGTKHALAEIIAQRFPEEVGARLPPKRRPWTSEDCRMGIFDAIALALMVLPKSSDRSDKTMHQDGMTFLKN